MTAKFDQFTAELTVLCRRLQVSLGILASGSLVILDRPAGEEPFSLDACIDGTLDPNARHDH